MTEQIKSAIETIENRDSIMDYCENRQLSDSLDLAIRSLKAWEEVLQELEEERAFEDSIGNDEARVELDMCIRIINQKLAEIEERNY